MGASLHGHEARHAEIRRREPRPAPAVPPAVTRGRLGLSSAAAGGLGLLALTAGAPRLGALLVALAPVLGLRARYWLSLAGRSRVGARSEDEVRRALASLEQQGWRVRHGLRWSDRGDIDSVVVAPNGVGFAIETKSRTYDERHLGRVFEQARWLGRRRRRWCPRGALAVLCVVCAAGVERSERGVVVESTDRGDRSRCSRPRV